MKRNLKRRVIPVLIVLFIALIATACGNKGVASDKELLKGIDLYFKSEGHIAKTEDLNAASWFSPGNSLTDWIVITESRQGADFDREKYLSDLSDFVTEAYKTEIKLDRIKATEWHRIILAIKAAGGNPICFASDIDGNPINLLDEGIYNWTHTSEIDMQGSNAIIYALICIGADEYIVPDDAIYDPMRLAQMLMGYQGDDGAFSLSGNTPDTDITAMAVQALATLKDSGDEAIEEAIEKAINYLSGVQRQGGYYTFGNHYSSDTCSQVILALCAAGIDPGEDERFIKAGRSVYDALLSFRNEDGGFASTLDSKGKPSASDMLATRQASSAIVAYMMLKQGNGNYFDFNNTLE